LRPIERADRDKDRSTPELRLAPKDRLRLELFPLRPILFEGGRPPSASEFFRRFARNPLKSLEYDEEIQGNPNFVFLVFLELAWFGLEKFGQRLRLPAFVS
jgi:hypothetical protein